MIAMSQTQDELRNPQSIDDLSTSSISNIMKGAEKSKVIGLGLDFGFAATPFVRNMPEDPFVDKNTKAIATVHVSHFLPPSLPLEAHNATSNTYGSFPSILSKYDASDRTIGQDHNDHHMTDGISVDIENSNKYMSVIVAKLSPFADAVSNVNEYHHSGAGVLSHIASDQDDEDIEMVDAPSILSSDVKEFNPQTPKNRRARDSPPQCLAPRRIHKRRCIRPFDPLETPTKPRVRSSRVDAALANTSISSIKSHVSSGLTPLVIQSLFIARPNTTTTLSIPTSPLPASPRTNGRKVSIPIADRLYSLRSAKNQPNFKLFSNLPPELQDSIWHFALSALSNRVVNLACVRTFARTNPPSKKDYVELISPLGYQIPGLFHATSASRKIALRAFPPAFQSIAAPTLGVQFNPENTILRLSLLSAQALAKCTTPSIATPRNRTRIVSLIFDHNYNFAHYKSQADLLLRAPHCAWAAVQEWQFPGTGPEETIVWAVVMIKRAVDLAEAEKREMRHDTAMLIKEAVDKTMCEKGDVVPSNIGIIARYA